mmetsp:Transcript_95846/g.228299  ORF Transcript_95846/g.228299 Transcript_95846/m.228299 type:complete len:198 (+) Transcript_95846:1368-1961(+)
MSAVRLRSCWGGNLLDFVSGDAAAGTSDTSSTSATSVTTGERRLGAAGGSLVDSGGLAGTSSEELLPCSSGAGMERALLRAGFTAPAIDLAGSEGVPDARLASPCIPAGSFAETRTERAFSSPEPVPDSLWLPEGAALMADSVGEGPGDAPRSAVGARCKGVEPGSGAGVGAANVESGSLAGDPLCRGAVWGLLFCR